MEVRRIVGAAVLALVVGLSIVAMVAPVPTPLVIAGVALVNARYGARRLFGRSAPAEPG